MANSDNPPEWVKEEAKKWEGHYFQIWRKVARKRRLYLAGWDAGPIWDEAGDGGYLATEEQAHALREHYGDELYVTDVRQALSPSRDVEDGLWTDRLGF